MILTIKRTIKLNKSQIEYYLKSIKNMNELSKMIYFKYIQDKTLEKLSYYQNINANLKETDSFALMDMIIEYRKTGCNSIKEINYYKVSNSKNNIKIYKDYIFVYGFGYIYMKNIDINKINKVYSCKIMHINGKYVMYINYCCEEIRPINLINKSIGLDYSIYDFYVDNNGNKIGFPDVIKIIEKISMMHSKLNLKTIKSNNYYKLKAKIRNLYNKIKGIKSNYLNQISNNLVNNYDLIAVEDLNLKELCKRNYIDRNGLKHKYGKYIYLYGYYDFINMLDYKCKIKGKKLIKVDRYFPSSKICYKCGKLNNITNNVNNRIIKCPNCGNIYNRDVNAAKNILKEGIRIYNSRINNE